MLGSLSQMIAICSAANGYLCGRFSVDGFFPNHREFKFCNSVTFSKPRESWFGWTAAIASKPNEWILSIKANQAIQVFLDGAKGPNSLVVQYSDRFDRWRPDWRPAVPKGPVNRVWEVTYKPVGSVSSPNPFAPCRTSLADLNTCCTKFSSALDAAIAFSIRQQHLDWFAEAFRRAEAILCGQTSPTFPDYVDFVCVDCYPDIAVRLFSAAYTAWVFGGMGSWTDQYFEDSSEQRHFEQISESLYQVVNEAILKSANSFSSLATSH